MSDPITKHEGKKYLRLIHSAHPDNTREPISVDVYAVLEAFKVTCPAVQHAVKKLLMPGQRGKGSILADLKGALAAISRAIELQTIREANEWNTTPANDDKADSGKSGDIPIGGRDATGVQGVHDSNPEEGRRERRGDSVGRTDFDDSVDKEKWIRVGEYTYPKSRFGTPYVVIDHFAGTRKVNWFWKDISQWKFGLYHDEVKTYRVVEWKDHGFQGFYIEEKV